MFHSSLRSSPTTAFQPLPVHAQQDMSTNKPVQLSEVFWSSDHMTGIRSLFEQLELGQSEGVATLGFFEEYTAIVDVEAQMFSQLSSSHKKFVDGNWSGEGDDSQLVKSFVETVGEEKKIGSLKTVMSEQARYATEVTTAQQLLSSRFNSDLILRLKDFLEDYRDFTSDSKKALQSQYNSYIRSVQQAQNVEKKITTKIRTLEDLNTKHDSRNPDNTIIEIEELNAPLAVQETPLSEIIQSPEKENGTPSTPAISTGSSTPTSNPQTSKKDSDSEDEAFQFPLTLGTTSISTVEGLRDLLFSMIQDIPIKRRMIPLPGVNNEYFTSENFSRWVKTHLTAEDTRKKVEQFGQDMIELGLMSNWNRLGTSLFVSDGGYYAFTDLARFTSKFDPSKELLKEDENKVSIQTPVAKPTPATPAKSNRKPIPPTSDIWNNFKSTFTTTATNVESLKEEIQSLELKYVESVNASNLERTKLDELFEDVCDRAETFENNRLTLIFTLNKLFTESIIADHQARAMKLTKALEVSAYNEETLKCEKLKRVSKSSAGWYWPKTEAKLVDHFKRSSLAVLDMDLVNQTTDDSDTDMKTKSIPVFVKLFIDELENVEDAGKLWESDLNVKKANEIKRFTVEYIGNHSTDENAIAATKSLVGTLFDKHAAADLVSFFKLYLLELPDSVIPFTSYDALVKAYETEQSKEHILTVLGSMPRQNLATLIQIVEHVSKKCTIGEDLVKSNKVPFYHLLLRPSPKRLTSFIVDGLVLGSFVYDLIDLSFQEDLLKKLIELEEFNDERQKRVQDSISRLKQERERVSATSSPITRQKEAHLTAEGLRAFKTKSPVPTPISSPKVGRSRTNTNLSPAIALTPKVRRPSENLNKRNSLLGDS